MRMAVRLPLLHTFVMVARAGRMRDAAAGLALTPGAVSQRIRELETVTGQRLFDRTRTGVALTPAGRMLFDALDAPFRAVEEAGERLEKPYPRRIRVSTMASFAANWLVPRLRGFARRHPDIDVAVETDSRIVDLRREPVDLAIRHGLGDYPGLEAAIREPADCLAFPLLHDSDRTDWRLWFEAQGVESRGRLKGSSFSDDHLMVRAAAAGQGLALVRDVYADDELRAGRLVRAIEVQWPTRFAYYAVGTAEALQKPAVRRFREWLVGEAARAP
jgi:LysR family glycine cleavage system transcriptional activator